MVEGFVLGSFAGGSAGISGEPGLTHFAQRMGRPLGCGIGREVGVGGWPVLFRWGGARGVGADLILTARVVVTGWWRSGSVS